MIDSSKQTPPKRANGTGSIRPLPDGSGYRVRVTVGERADGTSVQRERRAKTMKEAVTVRRQLENSRDDGTLLDADKHKITVAQFMERWLEAAKGQVRPKTWHRYEEYVAHHVTPTLGRMKLRSLTPDAIQALYGQKRDEGLAPRTVHHLHAVIRRACHQAVKWGYLVVSPVDRVDAPHVPDVERTVPSLNEQRRLLRTAQDADDRLYPLWATALGTGCRLGELLGLKWQDLDLDAGKLTIQRGLASARAGTPTFAEPKNARSRRRLSLPGQTIDALRQHRARQIEDRLLAGGAYRDFDLVFCSHTGTALLGSNVHRSYKAALARAGLATTFRFHDLRHGSATSLLASGIDLKTVSARLGHANIQTTGNIYLHAVDQLDADAAARLDAALGRLDVAN